MPHRETIPKKTMIIMNENLKRIANSEDLQEDFFITLAGEMASDEEPARKKWRGLQAAYEKNPEMVNDILMTLCGWTMESLAGKALANDDPACHVPDDDPSQAVYENYSPDMRKAVAYINEQLEPEDKAIICAMVEKNFKLHLNPAHDIDDMKIIDLLEEYGDDHDLGEDWWMEECDIDDIVLLIQFEN